MLELKRSVLKVNFYGEEMSIRFPTVKQINNFGKEDGEYDSLVKFLGTLGLEESKCEQLEMDHLKLIISTISGQGEGEKKN